ncbi:MAG: hypothetical protein WC482_03925 [Candidatus Omnitrophota bacterium]
MIEINLLPEEMKKKKRSASKIDASMINLSSLPIVNIVMIAVGALLAIQLALFVIGVISGIVFNSVDRKYKDILPKKNETLQLKTSVDTANKKVAAIDELMVKRFSWEKKLNALSNSMIPGIWLTELEYDEKITGAPRPVSTDPAMNKGARAAKNILSRYLILSGAASGMADEGTALIGRFIKSLKDDKAFYFDFSDIELGTIKREKMDDQEIMIFKITCFFKAR